MMPVFMIGTRRSGSNLLRLMINQLPEVAAPHPPDILQRMMPLVPLYGNLNDPNIFYQLVDDVCRLVELDPVPWEGVTLNRNDVASRCFRLNLVAVYGAVYDIYAESRGAKTWCCKSLANINYIKEIEDYFRRPKFIYLVRDGRDVAVSFQKTVVGEKHFYHIAKDWVRTQEIALRLRDTLDQSRFMSVRYEDLIADSESVARTICSFLALPTCPVLAMLDFYETEEAKRTAQASGPQWGNVANPVMKNNTRKFLSSASENNIRIFESVAGHVLDILGYGRVFVKQGEEIKFTKADVAAFDAENEQMKKEVMNKIDPTDLERRKGQEALIKEIEGRSNRKGNIVK